MNVSPATRLEGTIALPGDKSISHRAAIIAALANGTSVIENFSTAEDCRTTLRCLRQLGVEIEEGERGKVTIHGVGKRGLRQPDEPVDCGNSGTTMRLLSGVLAGQPFESVLTGDQSLRKRPMRRVAEPLNAMGADVTTDDGLPPIRIRPVHRLAGLEHQAAIASAQVKSCLLLAGLNADGRTTVAESAQTRDHSERMLDWFGAKIESVPGRVSISGSTALITRDIAIPADLSAASFFLVAAAILPNSRIKLANVGVNPTRTAILDVLREAGLKIELTGQQELSNEPVADLEIYSSEELSKGALKIAGPAVAALIDEIPILAVLGSQLEGGLEIREAGELRHKESDRIAVVVDNLRRMGADVEEFPDGFRVSRSRLRGASIDPHGDHRIAMAFAVAALAAEGDTTIIDSDCAGISFPNFFETLKSVVM